MGLQPIGQSVARAHHQVLGGGKTHDQETDGPHPGLQLDRRAQHRSPHDFDQVVQGIEVGDPAAVLQQFGRPHDGREEEGDLEEVGDDRQDVPVAHAQDAEQNPHPDAVQQENQQARNDQQERDAWPVADGQQKYDHHRQAVQQDAEIAPDDAADMDAQRHADLLDQKGRVDHRVRALGDDGRDVLPDHQAHAQVGQVGDDVLLEQGGIQHTEHTDHDEGAQGEPERTEDRTPVTLADVVPAQGRPHVRIAQPDPDVAAPVVFVPGVVVAHVQGWGLAQGRISLFCHKCLQIARCRLHPNNHQANELIRLNDNNDNKKYSVQQE